MRYRIVLAIIFSLSAWNGAGAAQHADDAAAFGYKTAWLAVRANEPRAVADALGMTDVRGSTWASGIDVVEASTPEQHLAFVSDPIRGWILVEGFAVASSGDVATPAKRLVALSRRFGEAQFFASMRTDSYYAWARASHGKLLRAFEYDGSKGVTIFNIGARTDAEKSVNLEDPGEEDVLRVAGRWSVNPATLDGAHADGNALLGALPEQH